MLINFPFPIDALTRRCVNSLVPRSIDSLTPWLSDPMIHGLAESLLIADVKDLEIIKILRNVSNSGKIFFESPDIFKIFNIFATLAISLKMFLKCFRIPHKR